MVMTIDDNYLERLLVSSTSRQSGNDDEMFAHSERPTIVYGCFTLPIEAVFEFGVLLGLGSHWCVDPVKDSCLFLYKKSRDYKCTINRMTINFAFAGMT